MDLPICSACSSPTPAGSSIKLKTCQHSFCVLCLKYALMYGGTPDLQCPYPLGTFECGAKPNEAEVQFILEYEDEFCQDVPQDQDADTIGGNDETIGKLGKSLDRVLSIDADEFPGEPKEELPSVKELNLNGVDVTKDNASVDANEIASALERSEEKLAVFLDDQVSDADIILSSGTDQLLGTHSKDVLVDPDEISKNAITFSPECGSDRLQGTDSIEIEPDWKDSADTEPDLFTTEEIALLCEEPTENPERSIESKNDPVNGPSPTLSTGGFSSSEQESCESEKASGELLAPCLEIDNGTSEAEPSPTSANSVTTVKDESKGAIPKVPKSSAQAESNDSGEASNNAIPPTSTEDQDLALAFKLQEEESKIDMDLLLAISDANLPPNMEPFECPVCYGQFKPYEGVTLTFCFHSFCKPCLAEAVKHSDELEVTCPALVDGNVKCSAIVQDGGIRELLSEEDFVRFQDRCLQTAEAVIPNTFHCLTPNCRGWVELIGEVEFFDCSICSVENCVSCKAIHEDQSCEEFQANIQRKDDDLKSEATLKTMVETREGMRCPKCGVMITKIEGCDFMTCTTCKTGICWPTRGPRWGPAGQGDISGGCRCKVDNGKRCHPECEGCH